MRNRRSFQYCIAFLALAGIAIPLASPAQPQPAGQPPTTASSIAPPAPAFFRITVVDEETHRGIPCVRLKLTNDTEYWTDSAGVAAFCEPDLMNQMVFFDVATHGYQFEKDAWFGLAGRALEVTPGGSVELKMHRDNIAQRLFRMTGSGIYRDSILLGDKVPPVEEPGKPPIMGQDGADCVTYKGKLYWFWGDTSIPRFPLGNFKGTCATSEFPGHGGLDPEVGIAYTYLRKENGEPRFMTNLPGGVYWYGQIRTVLDKKGQEHLLSEYAEIQKPMRAVEHGLLMFNDDTGYMDLVCKYPEDAVIPFDRGQGPPFRYTENGKEYFYSPAPYPNIRYPTDFESQTNFDVREAFTCLKEGSRFDGSAEQLDRDPEGNLRWSWKHNTSPIAETEMYRLVKAGSMKPEERWYAVVDVNSGTPVLSHSGSVYWNDYRKRWVCIRCQTWGETLIGEVWYLEGDTPLGPWVYATKIISHAWKDHAVSFYTVGQTQQFDKNDGRTIFVKGSFSAEFGDSKVPVPRQNYNTFMYKLELNDPRVFLPVPIYSIPGSPARYGTKEAFQENETGREIVCYAPDRQRQGTVPVYAAEDTAHRTVRLTLEAGSATAAKPVFYAVPSGDDIPSTSPLKQTVPLYEFVRSPDGHRTYATSDTLAGEGYVRSPQPVCRVWPALIEFNPYK